MIQGIFPLQTVSPQPFEEAPKWLQFAYITERTKGYVVPASMVLVQSVVVEWDALFPAYFYNLRKR